MELDEAQLRLQLDSKDHFEVCAVLKRLGQIKPLSPETIQRIVALAAPGIKVVELNALQTLIELGPCAADFSTTLLRTLASEIDKGGCTFDCCGYWAYYAPVLLYIRAIFSLEAVKTRVDLETRIFPKLKDLENLDLMKEALDIHDFDSFKSDKRSVIDFTLTK